MVSATARSSGKTTVATALCRLLARRGHRVQPYKKGPDYIDASWLAAAAGRPCYHLDFHTQTVEEIHQGFNRPEAGFRLVEGNQGLYDSVDVEGQASNAALARGLGLPVVLVVNAAGMTRGIAPLLLGYRDFEPVVLAGVILNRVGGSRHESKLRGALERYTDIPLLGVIGREPALSVPERHLGLVPHGEHDQAEAVIEAAAALVEQNIDVDALLGMAARGASTAPTPAAATGVPDGQGLVVAVARDAAFGFYYADDLDTLAAAGVTLVFFSPLSDAGLPDCDGLWLGGGFPERHARRLADNRSMRDAVRGYARDGGVVHAECGGLMYLCESLTVDQCSYPMAGVIPATTGMQAEPVGRGLVRLAARDGSAAAMPLPAHEFHHSALASDVPLTFAYRVLRGHGVDGRHDGIVVDRVLASYAHQRHTRANPWLAGFIARMRQRRGETT